MQKKKQDFMLFSFPIYYADAVIVNYCLGVWVAFTKDLPSLERGAASTSSIESNCRYCLWPLNRLPLF